MPTCILTPTGIILSLYRENEVFIVTYLYIIRCRDNSLFADITKSVTNAVINHNQKLGPAYTRAKSRRPVAVIISWEFKSEEEAIVARNNFRKMKRKKKMKHISEALLTRLK
jgi:putative endonuclease